MIEIEEDKFDNNNNIIENDLKYIRLQNEINELNSDKNQIICKKIKLEEEINHLNQINKDLEKHNLI